MPRWAVGYSTRCRLGRPGAFPEIPLQIDTQALAVVPLVHEGVSLGALGLSYDIPEEFDAGTRAFLEFAGQECALAVVRVKDEAGPPLPT